MIQDGKMVIVRQKCSKCSKGCLDIPKVFTRHGKIPADNLLLSLTEGPLIPRGNFTVYTFFFFVRKHLGEASFLGFGITEQCL